MWILCVLILFLYIWRGQGVDWGKNVDNFDFFCRYIQDNYSKIQNVEKELSSLALEVKLTAGPKKAGTSLALLIVCIVVRLIPSYILMAICSSWASSEINWGLDREDQSSKSEGRAGQKGTSFPHLQDIT